MTCCIIFPQGGNRKNTGAWATLKPRPYNFIPLYHRTSLQVYHWATMELYQLWAKHCGKIGKHNLCLIDMKHDLNLTLKMYKVVFSDKQITEIKKKCTLILFLHILTQKLHWKSAGINKDSNSTLDPWVVVYWKF
jgi:hypothetical protein